MCESKCSKIRQVSQQEFRIIKESEEVNITELRDSIASDAMRRMFSTFAPAVCDFDDEQLGAIAKSMSKTSFDFADAFMRERYERESVFRAMMQPVYPVDADAIQAAFEQRNQCHKHEQPLKPVDPDFGS